MSRIQNVGDAQNLHVHHVCLVQLGISWCMLVRCSVLCALAVLALCSNAIASWNAAAGVFTADAGMLHVHLVHHEVACASKLYRYAVLQELAVDCCATVLQRLKAGKCMFQFSAGWARNALDQGEVPMGHYAVGCVAPHGTAQHVWAASAA